MCRIVKFIFYSTYTYFDDVALLKNSDNEIRYLFFVLHYLIKQ